MPAFSRWRWLLLHFLSHLSLFSIPTRLHPHHRVYVCAERSVAVSFCPEAAKGAASLSGECVSQFFPFASPFVFVFPEVGAGCERVRAGMCQLLMKGKGNGRRKCCGLKGPFQARQEAANMFSIAPPSLFWVGVRAGVPTLCCACLRQSRVPCGRMLALRPLAFRSSCHAC